jgi:transcriptional regulator
MHPNLIFRKAEQAQNLAFARQRSFGTLVINAANAPLLAHIPFLLSEDGSRIEGHLVRSNPILKLIGEGIEAVMSVTGPDAYISPDWYEIDNQVPTWNYISVNLRGKLFQLPQDELLPHLNRLSTHFEKQLAPKPVWTLDKMDEQALAKMTRMIVPIALEISEIDGTWKLAQNKPDQARIAAAQQVKASKLGSQTDEIAGLMNNPPC